MLTVEAVNITEDEFIRFITQQGVEVKTNTGARGNLGICFKNRIDVSKKLPKDKRIRVLAHEYAHKIHHDIEKNSLKNGGSLLTLFKTDNSEILEKELKRVTYFVDENSLFLEYKTVREELLGKIKALTAPIKVEYPDFKRSSEFKPISQYFKKHKSNARYLLKYDHVKLVSPVFRKEEFVSISSIDETFSEIPENFRIYLKLLSLQRKLKKLSARKNRLEKYYNRPTELFARFIEGLFFDKEKVKLIAPQTFKIFVTLLVNGYYGNLKELLLMAGIV
jgi:hypothetical protein